MCIKTFINAVSINTVIGDEMSITEFQQIVNSYKLPPSAKFVLKILVEKRTTTLNEIINVTGLPQRTVKYALKKLRELGLIRIIPCLADARKRYYTICFELSENFSNPKYEAEKRELRKQDSKAV